MLSKKLSQEIRQAADDMTQKEFADFLLKLNAHSEIKINHENWDFAIDFARYLVDKMRDNLDRDEWIEYEIKALAALDDIPCNEDDIIKIDTYGFPQEIKSNNDLLDVMGISDYLSA